MCKKYKWPSRVATLNLPLRNKQAPLTYEAVNAGTLPIVDSHDRGYHLVDECLRKSGLLQGLIDGLVQHAKKTGPSEGLEQVLRAAEGIVAGLVSIDPGPKKEEGKQTG